LAFTMASLQVLYRAGIIHSSQFLGLEYFQGLTLHGVVNAIVFTTFFAVAFGYAVVRTIWRALKYDGRWLSFALMMIGTLLSAAAILSGKATVLYTFIRPAPIRFLCRPVLVVVGSWLAFLTGCHLTLPGNASIRRKNPLAVVGIFAAFIVWLIATAPVAVEILFLLIPGRWVGSGQSTYARPNALLVLWHSSSTSGSSRPTSCTTRCCRTLRRKTLLRFRWSPHISLARPLFCAGRYSSPIHRAGITDTWKFVHAFFTMLVAVPSFLTAFTMAASMEQGRAERRARPARVVEEVALPRQRSWLFSYLFAGLFIFIFGGVTGIINASYNMNNVVHNTAWLPAHFHQTVAGPVFLSYSA
jgi:cytochrome c oxidase subunit 1